MSNLIVIDDHNWTNHAAPPAGHAMGLEPRDMAAHPRGSVFPVLPTRLPSIPQNEWQDRLDDQKLQKARFMDYLDTSMGPGGGRIPCRDQNGQPYCWMHSGVNGMMAVRAMMGLPYADLSAYGPACKIKNFASSGGWGAEGCKFLYEKGCPTSATWPQQSKSRSNDNPNTWAEAAKYKLTEYYELDDGDMKAQLVTVLLSGGVAVVDYNWWSHSVLACGLESINPFVIWIWNSWGESWSEGGFGQLKDGKAIPSDSTAMLVATAA